MSEELTRALAVLANLPPAVKKAELPPEEVTILAVMAASRAAFSPRGDREVTGPEVVKVCAALVTFLEIAGNAPARSFAEWREAILELKMTLGGKKP